MFHEDDFILQIVAREPSSSLWVKIITKSWVRENPFVLSVLVEFDR